MAPPVKKQVPAYAQKTENLVKVEEEGPGENLQKFETMSIGISAAQHPFYAKYMFKFAPEPTVDPSKVRKLVSPSSNGHMWKKLSSIGAKEGVIFDNDYITVGMKAEFHRFTGRIIMNLITKGYPLQNIAVDLLSPPGLELNVVK